MDVIVAWREGWYVVLWAGEEHGETGSLEEAILTARKLADTALKHGNRMRERKGVTPLPPARLLLDRSVTDHLLGQPAGELSGRDTVRA